MAGLEQEPRGDSGGVQAAIDRYRDLAKYLIAIFAGIGAVLIAGTQLSSLGELRVEDDLARLVAAGVALSVAVTSVLLVLGRAVSVLRPVEISLADVIDDPVRRAEANRRPSLLGGAKDVRDLPLLADSSLLDEDSRNTWRAVVDDVIDDAVFRDATVRFDHAWKSMLAYAVLGAVATVVFVYAANPPKESTAEPVVMPAPELVRFTLTSAGRETLSDTLGSACVKHPIRALATGGTAEAPVVVTLPQAGCTAAQFVLSPELGVAVRVKGG